MGKPLFHVIIADNSESVICRNLNIWMWYSLINMADNLLLSVDSLYIDNT